MPTDPLERVREGMEVVDQGGARLGQVKRVQLGAPEVTHPPDSDLVDELAMTVPSPPDMTDLSNLEAEGASPWGHDPAGLPDLPDELRTHLREVGFIELDNPRLRDVERFVAADHVDRVTEDRVVVRGSSTSE